MYADERRCTGPANDILAKPRSKGILLAVPSTQVPAAFDSFKIRPGAKEAREFNVLGGNPARVLRLSMTVRPRRFVAMRNISCCAQALYFIQLL